MKLVQQCQQAKFFSVLADETTDVSTSEQMSICVRYVHEEDATWTVCEDFLGFVETPAVTGHNLATLILESVAKFGLDLKYLCGKGFDGASNMSGAYHGARAIIQQQCPLAVYVHCRAHALNLAIVHSCSIPQVRNMLGAVQETAVFIGRYQF